MNSERNVRYAKCSISANKNPIANILSSSDCVSYFVGFRCLNSLFFANRQKRKITVIVWLTVICLILPFGLAERQVFVTLSYLSIIQRFNLYLLCHRLRISGNPFCLVSYSNSRKRKSPTNVEVVGLVLLLAAVGVASKRRERLMNIALENLTIQLYMTLNYLYRLRFSRNICKPFGCYWPSSVCMYHGFKVTHFFNNHQLSIN